MARVAFRLWVKPGKLEEYVEHHAAVWPDLLADMKTAGIRNYSIWSDDLELFGSYECDDPEAAAAFLASSDANARWQEFMKNYLATPVDPEAGMPSRQMVEVFRME